MKIYDFIKQEKKLTFYAIFFDLLAVFSTVFASYCHTFTLNAMIDSDSKKVIFFSCLSISLFLICGIFDYYFHIHVNQIREKSLNVYRSRISNNMKNTSAKLNIDSYISALNNDAVQIDNAISTFFASIDGMLNMLTSLFALITFHWEIAVTSIAILFLNRYVSRYLSEKAEKNELKRSSAVESFFMKSSDLLKGFTVFNLYNAKKHLSEKLLEETTNYETERKEVNDTNVFLLILPSILNNIGMGVLLFVTLRLIIVKQIAAGSILTIEQLAGFVSQGFTTGMSGLISIQGINATLQKRTEQIAEEDKTIQNIISYNLSIQNLSFSYPDKTIFSNVSLHFESGKKYLIIGPSGYGKTTLLNLIDKNLTEYTGSIVLGEKDYSELNHATVHHYIGYVEQTPYIFKDTLKENITLGNTYTGEEIQRAMQEALVTDFMNDEDDVIDPNGISGGQKQRIALARELIADHKIILFDESINALDKAMTKEIVKQLLSLKQTVILVSHSYDEEMMKKFDCVIDISKC